MISKCFLKDKANKAHTKQKNECNLGLKWKIENKCNKWHSRQAQSISGIVCILGEKLL